jgi:hypothetical protein
MPGLGGGGGTGTATYGTERLNVRVTRGPNISGIVWLAERCHNLNSTWRRADTASAERHIAGAVACVETRARDQCQRTAS